MSAWKISSAVSACSFQVSLSDHEIPIPKLMFMKIDEIMELDLDFFLSPVEGGARS